MDWLHAPPGSTFSSEIWQHSGQIDAVDIDLLSQLLSWGALGVDRSQMMEKRKTLYA
jgi:hypothetical protein